MKHLRFYYDRLYILVKGENKDGKRWAYVVRDYDNQSIVDLLEHEKGKWDSIDAYVLPEDKADELASKWNNEFKKDGTYYWQALIGWNPDGKKILSSKADLPIND